MPMPTHAWSTPKVAQSRDERARRGIQFRALARDAHRRDRVDEAGRRRGDHRSRSSVEVGAARKTRSSPVRSEAAIQSGGVGVMSG
jgi:hypothetical protein